MKKILLTAFEPFGGQNTNASQEVARMVRNESFAHAQVETLELPVEHFRAPQLMLSALARLRPDIVLLLGEARSRAAVMPERVAINVADFSIPDNAGNQPREETILEGGPAAYFSTLPVVAIQRALQEAGIPAAISNTAGTYLCNQLFYCVLHHLSETKNPALAGFIHIPMLPEQRPDSAQEWPSLCRETALKAVRITIETCLETQKLGEVSHLPVQETR
jgi:pyroglutamyl-peptidase